MMRRISTFLFLFSLICLSSPCTQGLDLLSIAKAEGSETKKTARALSHYIQAGIYERLNQLDKATQEYKAALKADYHSPLIHLRLAATLLKQNQLSQAAEELKLAIKYYETHDSSSEQEASFIEAHTLLALVYSLQGKSDQATGEYETALRSALAVDPQNIRIHKSLAQVYLRKNKFSDAEKTYRFILSLAPSDFESHFFLGTIYEQQNKRRQAIEEFKAALKFNPEYPDALNSLGYLYAEESINLKEAEEMIKQALIYEPTNGAYVDSLGWVYFKQGRYEEAIQELEQAVQFLSDPVIYEHLGDVYLEQGNLIKARENWQKSLESDSEENLQVREKLEQYK
jgi:Tfp pilus assembly protein PilF